MATVMYIPEKKQSLGAMKGVMDYVCQEKKTRDPVTGQRFVTGVHCLGDNACREFLATKRTYGKTKGMNFYQYVQSFSPKEAVTLEKAHAIALEFAQKAWPGFEVLVATHRDAGHLHSHFVVNSVSWETGLKLRQSPKTLQTLRALSDEICAAQGLSVLPRYEKPGAKLSSREYRAAQKGESWKFRLMGAITQAMERSGTRRDFLRAMERRGYHALLRRAFQQAFKEERIEANPFDRVGRPKKNKFHGENYTQEELLTLLHLARGDVIYPAILLAGAMGLRRSEALGVRWSRIDWEKRTVLLDTKIVEYRENGKKKVEPVEEMKNKSSRRTLPLPDPVVEMLQVQKEHREVYRKMFQGSYNTQYLDYVCVNQLGELLRPSYVTDHFRELLEKYGLRHIRFHDLRHTFASLLINQDVPLINVSNFLGHSDLSTTANIYAHLDKASKQASAAVISDILQGENQHAQPKGEPETNTDRQT